MPARAYLYQAEQINWRDVVGRDTGVLKLYYRRVPVTSSSQSIPLDPLCPCTPASVPLKTNPLLWLPRSGPLTLQGRTPGEAY